MKYLWILGCVCFIMLIGVVLLISSHAQTPRKAQIVFASALHGNAEIYVMDADGGNIRRLTDNAARDAEPAWSPDGQKIAFTSARDGGRNEIYVMDADGNNVRKLTRSAGSSEPAWSPDGRFGAVPVGCW